MDVFSDVGWCVEVYYMCHVVNIDTSRHNIRAHKDVCMSVSQRVEAFLSLLLRLLTMNKCNSLPGTCQEIMQVVHISDQVDENDDRCLMVSIEDLHKFGLALAFMCNKLDSLLDSLFISNLTYLDERWALEVLTSHLLDEWLHRS